MKTTLQTLTCFIQICINSATQLTEQNSVNSRPYSSLEAGRNLREYVEKRPVVQAHLEPMNLILSFRL